MTLSITVNGESFVTVDTVGVGSETLATLFAFGEKSQSLHQLN
jgi:hypothetical protein